MPRQAKRLSVGNDNTQHLSFGVIALCFPLNTMQVIIDSCQKSSQRVRDLPAVVVACYVIAMGLFPSVGYEGILRWLLCGLQWIESFTLRVSSKAALSKARIRLGERPMKLIFDQLATPLNDLNLKGNHWKGMLTVAIDGSTLALQDTPSNVQVFGRSSNQHGQAAYPLARFVALVETGTHVIFAATLGSYRDSEITLANKIIGNLKPGMLCLADRLFPGLALWRKASATGAQLLWRAKVGLKLKAIKHLSDGSWLAEWKSGNLDEGKPTIVRVIEYRLKKDSSEIYRLLTTILDPKIATATELASFYPQRWEIELTIKEGKNVLRKGTVTLRSKTAELTKQEFWGLLLSHYIIRKMMALAALEQNKDPDELSFKGSVEIINAHQTGPHLSFSP